jgi:hypothetical protein
MRRFVAATLVALISISVLAADTKTLFQKRYEAFNRATERNSQADMEKWLKSYCTKDFVYTSHDKNKYPLKTYLGGIKDQVRAIKKVTESTIKIDSIRIEANKVVLSVSTNFEGVVSFQGQNLKLVDKSKSTDVWIRSGSDWKLRSVTQTKSDTQMFQK